MTSKVTTTGGDKLKALTKKAERNKSVSYDIGFFPKAKYADGTPVALVALWNEFGTKNIPERPFFRAANKKAAKSIAKLVRRFLDPLSKTMDKKDAGKIAAFHVGQVQEEIVNLRSPPNAEGTKNKKNSSNPLVDAGLMKSAVTFEVE